MGGDTATCDRLWTNARLATMAGREHPYGRIDDGVIAARDGRIAYAGPRSELPAVLVPRETIDCAGRWITPGLIDCHTHLVYAGSRAREFEARLDEASDQDIARAGGILATVAATRAASEDDLVKAALRRLDPLIAEGLTTVEIKSGYGLDLPTEKRQLAAARRLGQLRAVEVVTTFLGAHAMPPEAEDDRAAYIDRVCREMIPAIASEGLADAVDGYCEAIGFSPDEIARVFEAARAAGLPVKLHADHLSNFGGARLAARFGALSADHLQHLDETGAAALADSGTVAVLLPGTVCFLRETQAPPVALLRHYKVPIALATGCNPGTSPLTSLLLTMNMGATLFRLTVAECLAGVTREAARALGRLDEIGTIEPGKWCNLAIWDVDDPAELVYHMGANPLCARVWRGR